MPAKTHRTKSALRVFALAALLFFAPLLSGCVYILAAQAALAGTAVIVYGTVVGTEHAVDIVGESMEEEEPQRIAEFTMEGDLVADTPHAISTVHVAAWRTFIDMAYTVEVNELEAERGRLVAVTASEIRISVEMERLAPMLTRVKIRVGEDGNFEFSEDILDHLHHIIEFQHLDEIAAPPSDGEEPGETTSLDSEPKENLE